MDHGEIWWANLNPPSGRRPVLVLTRSSVINIRDNVTVAQITRTSRGIASEVKLTVQDGVKAACVVSLDEIMTVRKIKLERYMTRLSKVRMMEVYKSIHFALDLPF